MDGLPPQRLGIQRGAPWWKLRAGWIYGAILQGELLDHTTTDVVRYPLQCEPLGRLALPGGRLVAADPYLVEVDAPPFEQRLSRETADVVAVRARVGEQHERVAALVLHVGSSPVADWVMATVPGQDAGSLEGEGFFGYGVDAGTGSFGSPEGMKVASDVLSADGGMLEDPISRALFADGIGTRSAVLVAPQDGAPPIAVCSSGWGDGAYPTWLGVDADGSVMVAVTDFLLTGDPHVTATQPPSHQRRRTSMLRRWFGA